jgi:hypothetical protein
MMIVRHASDAAESGLDEGEHMRNNVVETTFDATSRELHHIACAAGIHQLHRRIPEYWVTEGDAIRYASAGVLQARYLPLGFDVRAA